MTDQPANLPATIESFSFGDDVSVLDGREAWGYFEGVYENGDWYEPPVPMRALAKSFRMNPQHQSAVIFKLQQLERHFIPSRWLDAVNHRALALDLLQMGNLYAEELPNLAGRPLAFKRSPALHTRVGVKPGTYYFVKPGIWGGAINGHHEFKTRVHHIYDLDVEQEIYGMPEWLAALQSALLNESATLFRRRYYLNGGHAGYVFYVNDPSVTPEMAAAMSKQIKDSKGRNNFKNIFIHIPAANKDGIQIKPLAEVAAKDEFAGIKNVTIGDILTAHRIPPQLIGVIPTNNGGFGDIRSAADTFFRNEVGPLMSKMLRLNEMTGVQAVTYSEYQPMMPGPGTAA